MRAGALCAAIYPLSAAAGGLCAAYPNIGRSLKDNTATFIQQQNQPPPGLPGDDALPEPRGAPPGDAADPAEQLATRAGAEELEDLIRGLREPYGKIAVLYFLQHKDTAEIAALTGRPQTTVNNQLWRAKLLLRRQINERRLKE